MQMLFSLPLVEFLRFYYFILYQVSSPDLLGFYLFILILPLYLSHPKGSMFLLLLLNLLTTYWGGERKGRKEKRNLTYSGSNYVGISFMRE